MTETRNAARDAKIVKRYLDGETQERLGIAFHLTRTRVWQILNKAGVSYKDSPNAPQGDRYGFVGANITKDMKKKLADKAKRTGKSMSRVLEEALEKTLDERKS